MTQALPKLVTFEEFVNRLRENSSLRYELHNGEIVEMGQPVGEHNASYIIDGALPVPRQHILHRTYARTTYFRPYRRFGCNLKVLFSRD